jgi:orotate phosphoribosyltransferase
MNKIAHALLESKSVHIRPNDYFTWTSGTRAPIYCDNRQLISYPEYRHEIIRKFCHLIKEQYAHIEVIAGTATAGIPWAAWIAHELDLPMIYIRKKNKDHGTQSAIEGKIFHTQTTLIIEDLVSTGKSSLQAFHQAKAAGLQVKAVMSIFTYGLDIAIEQFKKHNIDHHALCDLEELLHYAGETRLLNPEDISTILDWREKV